MTVYEVEVSEELDKKFKKLTKKNKKQLRIIWTKVQEIREQPYHYKPLRNILKGMRRVHIDKHFVLSYEICEEDKTIRLVDYDHHDKIYHNP